MVHADVCLASARGSAAVVGIQPQDVTHLAAIELGLAEQNAPRRGELGGTAFWRAQRRRFEGFAC